ncbi:GNAT family N-acetyltransferase [Streptomyces sp. NPDC001068]|uniref:GNAT family N-acetyltransferase n=1 Tax=Streptomyces sp. NPDC001068 TaxID=3364544 RepID=UPI0036877775
MDIERVKPCEWSLYRDVRITSLVDAPHAYGWTVEQARSLSESQWRDALSERVDFFARSADEVVGIVGVVPVEENALARELTAMWVAPAARGGGVGHGLVRAVIEHARYVGARQVLTWVTQGNIPAERLYQAHDFAATGKVQPLPSISGKFEMEMSHVIC